jgi:NAD(P)-dependent dehydrogenase (short-subunit alcohol dehydrogenase family)
MKGSDSKEKSVLITGGTSGLGLELVRLFLKSGYYVIATGREYIRVSGFEDRFKLIQVDFSDMNKISETFREIVLSYNIGLVINNAGVLSTPHYLPTINGFEYTFQINFLSHLLINELILMRARGTNAITIAAVTSPVYRLADPELALPTDSKNYRAVDAYSSSKLFLTVMCEFLPSRFPYLNLKCFSFDPGTFSSGIYRTQGAWFRSLYQIAAPFMRSPGKVAEVLFQLIVENEVKNGMIYNFRKGINKVPVTGQKEKETFRVKCYNLLEPYLKQVD